MRVKLQSKKSFKTILILVGIGFCGYGGYQIFFAHFLIEEELHLSKIGVSETPEIVSSVVMPFTDRSHTVFDFGRTLFTTYDVFSVNNPINYTTQIVVRDENRIEKIIVFDLKSDDVLKDDLENQNTDGLFDFSQRIGNRVTILVKNGTNSFTGMNSINPTNEGDLSLVTIILLKNDSRKIGYDIGQIHIYPISEKHQSELNRVTLSQIKAQSKSNHVIEGISWIVIGAIAFEIVMNISRDKN